MATKKTPPMKRPKRKPKDIPANARLDTIEIVEDGQSYDISAYFEHDNGSYDLRLRVGKRTDLARQLKAVVEAIKIHPKREV